MNGLHDLQIPLPQTGKPEISMAPLVDIVFLLLIFFMVATVFPENDGLIIEKPTSENTARLDDDNIVIKLDGKGELHYLGKAVTLSDIRRFLREELALRPDAVVIVHADRRATTESLIQVIDAGKAGGAKHLGIATDDKFAQP
jgi:biopolymer transport protein ExbD